MEQQKVLTVEDLQAENQSLKKELEIVRNDLKIQVDARIDEGERFQALQDEIEALKGEVERLMYTPDAKEKATGIGEIFQLNGKKFKILTSAIRIPGLGRREALEILTDKEAQAWLVEKNSGAIQEVV